MSNFCFPLTKTSRLIYGVLIVWAILVLNHLILWFAKSGTPSDQISPNTKPPIASNPSITKSGCESLSGDEKFACLNRLDNANALTKSVADAAQKLDPKLCDTVSEWAKVACKDIVYFEIAMKSNKVEDCNAIQDIQKQKVCKDRFVSTKTPDTAKTPEVPNP